MTNGRRLYGTEHWRRRSLLQRRMQPLCAECLKGGRVTVAEQADHIDGHGGFDVNRFYLGRLQSLCRACHTAKTARENGRQARAQRTYDDTIGADGWFVDPRHPSNVADRARQALLRQLAQPAPVAAGDPNGSPTPNKSNTLNERA